ncbi:hypothetical protein OCU04_000366 [Sclerotinia nivalis]|uniref:Uncharacterized protein n=1 Tax=Sclerotinia nivalis TaxID=352851 RepID=A0A9X0DPN9_9HELO|nr:hypothetical protein OCU04_000366 [Sclerotinia nivalis]
MKVSPQTSSTAIVFLVQRDLNGLLYHMPLCLSITLDEKTYPDLIVNYPCQKTLNICLTSQSPPAMSIRAGSNENFTLTNPGTYHVPCPTGFEYLLFRKPLCLNIPIETTTPIST